MAQAKVSEQNMYKKAYFLDLSSHTSGLSVVLVFHLAGKEVPLQLSKRLECRPSPLAPF